jgi:hypothetical protein
LTDANLGPPYLNQRRHRYNAGHGAGDEDGGGRRGIIAHAVGVQLEAAERSAVVLQLPLDAVAAFVQKDLPGTAFAAGAAHDFLQHEPLHYASATASILGPNNSISKQGAAGGQWHRNASDL